MTGRPPTGRAVLGSIVKANDVRGRVPDAFSPEVAFGFGVAVAEQLAKAGAVLSGRDMRVHSQTLQAAFGAGVRSTGTTVVDVGLVATDQLYYATGRYRLPGAVFSPSHNPADYGGVKFARPGALPVGIESGLAELADRAGDLVASGEAAARLASGRTPGAVRSEDTLPGYAATLHTLADISGVRPLTVVVDAGNGMAGLTAPAVFAGTPVTVVPLYFELDGTFPNHEANPLVPANLVDLQAEVRRVGADAGLAFDGDADRCFVVDERGDVVSPSAVSALIVTDALARHPGGTVLHNAITSTVVADVVRERGGTPVRTKVGHAYIKAEMARTGAVFGAEHSAHYYFRDFWGADSGMLAALHVLALLGREPGSTLSRLATAYDRSVTSGEINSSVDDVDAVLARVRRLGPDLAVAAGTPPASVTVDELDGVTLAAETGPGSSPRWWVNVRPSNTEPLVRLNVEAPDAPTTAALRDRALAAIRG